MNEFTSALNHLKAVVSFHAAHPAVTPQIGNTQMNKFVNILEAVGKDFLKGLNIALKYAVPAANLAGLIFPQDKAITNAAVTSINLIQTAVMEVQQKYAASGIAKSAETNAQKLADVIALTSPTVIHLLETEGISIDAAGVGNIVDAVVALLKIQVVAA